MKNREAKSFNSQAITLKKSALEQAGLEIGGTLNYHIEDEKLIFEKNRFTLKEEIQEYYRNQGVY